VLLQVARPTGEAGEHNRKESQYQQKGTDMAKDHEQGVIRAERGKRPGFFAQALRGLRGAKRAHAQADQKHPDDSPFIHCGEDA